MTTTAHLTDGTTATVAERLYLTRGDGSTVLYAVRTTSGRIIAASEIRYIA